jgi:tRNA nucleotidyltransferase (CCA-adding enzyme)
VLSKTDCAILCKNLKLDNAFKSNAIAVCDMLRAGAPKSRAGIKQYLSAYGAENFECFIKALEISEDETDSIKAEFLSILEAKEPYSVSHLAIGGNDLMSLGFFGKEIGEKLEFLKNAVIEDPALNQKEKLIELITK